MSEKPQPQSPKFYLTTPIYYVNARPHIGHAYTTIVADVLARRHRLLGHDTFFLTGTDEHGQKIERSAASAGIPPQQFADEVSAQFRALWDRMGLTYDRYIRTTDPAHKRGVQKLFRDLYDGGFIQLGSYTGSYCVSDEAFVDLPEGFPCPDCGRSLETITEENFLFKLGEFQHRLIELIEPRKDGVEAPLRITPERARNEVLSFLCGNVAEQISYGLDLEVASADFDPLLDETPSQHLSRLKIEQAAGVESPVVQALIKEGRLGATVNGTLYVPGALRDLSVSRSSFIWGIPVPEYVQRDAKATQSHVIYVWLDALANYITAIGYGSDDPIRQAEFARYWPADLHLVGKEITRFHCVYWPAFLLAAGLATPKQITANGWLLFDNAKMSKSRGNVVRTETILEAFGTLCPPTLLPSAQNSVILSEGRSPQSKDLHDAGLASDAKTLSATEPQPPTQAERDLFATDILRYFLLREIPFGQDGSFSFDALITRYNADLANGYGNLVSRTLNMINQYFGGEYQDYETDFYFDWIQNAGTSNHLWIGFGKIEAFQRACKADPALKARIDNQEPGDSLGQAIETYVIDGQFSQATELLTQAVTVVDGYLTQNAPWKLAKLDGSRAKLAEVLMNAAEAIRYITACAYDVLPFATAKVWQQLGLGDIEQAAKTGQLNNLEWGGLQPGTKLGPLSPIFPRADKSLAQVMIEMEESRNTPLKAATTPTPAAPVTANSSDPAAAPRTSSLDTPNTTLPVAGSTSETTTLPTTPGPHTEAPASAPFNTTSTPESSTHITIDDFLKVELRVAQILTAERIPKADKLLRLEVDLGTERRQILSGIAQHYTPEDLIGRRIIVVSNLAPRKMRGLDSHGMLLAASEGPDGKPILATFAEDLPLGSRVR